MQLFVHQGFFFFKKKNNANSKTKQKMPSMLKHIM